jgi:hypothetical protein
MKKEDKKTLLLRKAVNLALRKVDQVGTPNVARMLETKEGYFHIENEILNTCLQSRITPGAAIGQYESDNEL